MVVLLLLGHLVHRVAQETLSEVLCTVMRIARFSTIRKLLLANFNNSKASVPDSYTTIQ
jgi:ABC-type enterochelin transport system permease subunit